MNSVIDLLLKLEIFYYYDYTCFSIVIKYIYISFYNINIY